MKYNKKEYRFNKKEYSMMLALMLALSPLGASAQKISLGSCITRDGGQYKGEMVSGKP